MMKLERIPSQEGQGEPLIPQQLDFDFKEAELRARAKELRREHGWTEPYAMSVARMEFKKKEWDAKSAQKNHSN